MKNFFAGCSTETEWKQRYRELAKKYHPDRPNGNVSVFQAIAAQYEAHKTGKATTKPVPIWSRIKRRNRINKIIQTMREKQLKPAWVYFAYANTLKENRQELLRSDLELIAEKLGYSPIWAEIKCRENSIE